MTHRLNVDKIREDAIGSPPSALAATATTLGRSLNAGSSLLAPLSGRSKHTSVAWCDTPTVYNLSEADTADTESSWRVARDGVPCCRGEGQSGSGWRLPFDVVKKVFLFVSSSRDLRSCCVVSRCWRRAIGPSNGAVALRKANSWQPYSGCWWIPKDAYTIMVVNLHVEDQNRPTAEGLMLRKTYFRRPSLFGSDCEIKIDRYERRVRVALTARAAVVKWFVPAKPTDGVRSQRSVEHGTFDCSAVIGLTATSFPTPGRVIPRQLYLANEGGTLKCFPDSHLRRPKSRTAWLDIEEASTQLTGMLERSDWATLKTYHDKPGPYVQQIRHLPSEPSKDAHELSRPPSLPLLKLQVQQLSSTGRGARATREA